MHQGPAGQDSTQNFMVGDKGEGLLLNPHIPKALGPLNLRVPGPPLPQPSGGKPFVPSLAPKLSQSEALIVKTGIAVAVVVVVVVVVVVGERSSSRRGRAGDEWVGGQVAGWWWWGTKVAGGESRWQVDGAVGGCGYWWVGVGRWVGGWVGGWVWAWVGGQVGRQVESQIGR